MADLKPAATAGVDEPQEHAKPADSELVLAASRGSDAAFVELRKRYDNAVRLRALRIIWSSTDAEDVSQVVWLKAFRSLDRFDIDAKFSTWILTIARNEAIDWLKRNRHRLDDDTGLKNTSSASHERPFDEALLSCLRQLTPRELRIVRLRSMDEEIFKQVAAVVGTSTTTAFTIYALAIKRLRRCLQQKGHTTVVSLKRTTGG